jgi:hypothetical protein
MSDGYQPDPTTETIKPPQGGTGVVKAKPKSATKAIKPKKVAKPAEKSALDKWETRTIHRSLLKNAPYNPRRINDKARKKLRDNIKKMGLMGGIVWNELTGNIVAGHQRIDILDSIEGKADYLITVTVVKLTNEEEKTQNLFMNNTYAQGDFDLDRLEDLLTDLKGSEDSGFSRTDQIQIFGKPFDQQLADQHSEVVGRMGQVLVSHSNMKKQAQENDGAFYTVLVFKDMKDMMRMFEMFDIEQNRFQGGWDFIADVIKSKKVVDERGRQEGE